MKKIVSIAIVIALLAVSVAIAGNAYGKNKVQDTPGARECAGVNFDPKAGSLGVADEVIPCLQAKGLAINSAVCSAAKDNCCNVAYESSDPDCTPVCVGAGESCASVPCCAGLTCNGFTGLCE